MKAWACALASLTFFGCSSEGSQLPYYVDATLTPNWVPAAQRASLYRVADYQLVDQAGHPFTSDSLVGRVHVANFFFAKCGDICPTTHRLLRAVADTFATDDRVVIVSYSVTPERDSVAALAEFAQHNAIAYRRWRLLTGERATIDGLTSSYLIGKGRGGDYGVDSVAHTEMIALVDGQQHIRGVYNGTLQLDVQQLTRDIRTLLAVKAGR